MADAPRFPSPDEAKRKDANVEGSPAPARAPMVVRRAEPEADPAPGEKPKLTKDEVAALLAVDGANRSSTATKLWRRGRTVIVPVGLVTTLVQIFFGSAAPFVSAALSGGALLWTARPLFKRDGWD